MENPTSWSPLHSMCGLGIHIDKDGLNVQSQELFGFGLGEYEEKEIRCLVQFLERKLFTTATHFCHATRVYSL